MASLVIAAQGAELGTGRIGHNLRGQTLDLVSTIQSGSPSVKAQPRLPWLAIRSHLLGRLSLLAIFLCSIGQTLQGSFSAVSKPNLTSKYALESSRRDLHNALLCTALKSHFFKNVLEFCQNLRKFSEI